MTTRSEHGWKKSRRECRMRLLNFCQNLAGVFVVMAEIVLVEAFVHEIRGDVMQDSNSLEN